ncbi:MAG TPA: PilZ domain-containing protein [Allosphingosinicella sp.]|jgi:hypothetical protein
MSLHDPDGAAGRRAERRRLDAQARLSPNSWSTVTVKMIDLSSGGFRAECEARVPAGSGVSIEIEGIGAVEAQVEWQRRGEIGARFLQPVELDRCLWPLQESESTLARLLVQRAAARNSGRSMAEADLRRRILKSLPIQKGRISA